MGGMQIARSTAVVKPMRGATVTVRRVGEIFRVLSFIPSYDPMYSLPIENYESMLLHIFVRRSERGSGSFWSGFVVGGVVCGVLGFVFAPQISRALLGEEQKLRLPRFLEEEDLDPEVTKQNLADKIAQLNAAIDDVSAQLKSQEPAEELAT